MILQVFYFTLNSLIFICAFAFPFLLRNVRARTIAFIILTAVIFGILNFSYKFEITGANYISYIQPIKQNQIVFVNFQEGNVLPGYFVFAYIIKNFLLLEPVFVQKFIRFLLFVFLLFGVKELAKLVRNKYNLPDIFVFFAVFIFAFDWHSNFLLIGVSFRNALGQVFYVFFLFYLFRNQRLKYILLGVVAILSHKAFLLAVPITFFLFKGLNFIKKLSPLSVFFLFTLASVILIKFLQIGAKHFNPLAFGDKLFHPVPTGVEVVGAGIGIWLILIFHALLLFFLFKFFPMFKKRDILFFSGIILGASLIASKVNILGIQFVEPTRFYFLMGPFLGLIGAYFLTQTRPKTLVLPILTLYAGYNLALMNFSKQSTAPTIQFIGKPFLDFWEFFFNFNIAPVLLCTLYVSMIFLFLLVSRKSPVIFSLLILFNTIVFLGLYSIGGYIFPFSILYFMFFSVWFHESREGSFIGNLLLNLALFLLWEIGYILLNLTAVRADLLGTMIQSLLIWAFLVLVWNFVSVIRYIAKYHKFNFYNESSKSLNHNVSS